MEKIKLLYLTPHLSTGGMPQFVLKRIQLLQNFKESAELLEQDYYSKIPHSEHKKNIEKD